MAYSQLFKEKIPIDIFLDFIKLIELPDTTIILHTRAITGNIV